MINIIFLISVLQLIEWIIIVFLCLALIVISLRLIKKQQFFKVQLETKNKELETISENYKLQLEQSNTDVAKQKNLWEYKEGVTQMLLHDLKNPLSLIINYELFSKELLGHAADQMMNIITNIGDVQNHENTKMNVQLKEVQLLKILNEAYSQVEFLFNEKKLIYYNNINEDLRVYVDEKLLERVLVNLLLNAIKYTSHGGNVRVVADKEQNKIKISIIDTGIIIPEDIHNLVFDKFGLLVAKKSNAGRSGNLGLSFCKLAIEAHNEIIGIKSDKDQTTFWFTLKPIGVRNELIKESKSQNNKSEISLSKESKRVLKQYIDELKLVEVYEFTAIRNIIKHIEEFNDPDIQSWMNNLKQTIKSGDEESYYYLIKMAE